MISRLIVMALFVVAVGLGVLMVDAMTWDPAMAAVLASGSLVFAVGAVLYAALAIGGDECPP